ncbi:hypothetical protein RHO15_05735 [Utexia brackfieldae]|uniref:hypothetical protein n=1 Tax=Utexia brackfieldae TaxID=3074108 RepID=UPI00370D07D3
MENFPWTRLQDVIMPKSAKAQIDLELLHQLPPQKVKEYIGDGNYGGFYEQPDSLMLVIWQTGVKETQTQILTGWAT